MRDESGNHYWQIPYPADVLWGDIVPSGVIDVVEILSALGLLTEPRLSLIADFWNALDFVIEDADFSVPLRNQDYRRCNRDMIAALQHRGFCTEECHSVGLQQLTEDLLFPLYPFDLGRIDNFAELPPAENPDW